MDASLFQQRIPGKEIGEEDGRAFGGSHSLMISRRGAAYVLRRRSAVLANDMAVGKCGEELEIDCKRGPLWLVRALQGCSERGLAPFEDIFEIADILPGDPIAARCLGHGGLERNGRGLCDIVSLHPSEAGRRRACDRAEGMLGVSNIQRREHLREGGTKVARSL